MVNEDNTHDEHDVVMDTELPPEDVEIDEEEGVFKDKISALRAKLKACEEEKRQHLEEIQRMRADFLNSKRRLEEQLQRDKERITEKHMESLFPLADSFEMAKKGTAWEQADEQWKKGIEGIHNQLLTIFAQNGIEAFSPLGEEFNPHEQEALMDNGKDSIVSEVIQKGYRTKDRVIRPAKVAVGTK